MTSLKRLLPCVGDSALDTLHILLQENVAGDLYTGKEIPAPQAMFFQGPLSSSHHPGEARSGRVVLCKQPSPLSKLRVLTQLHQNWWLRVCGLVPGGMPNLMPIG